jgi:hypothetical protein
VFILQAPFQDEDPYHADKRDVLIDFSNPGDGADSKLSPVLRLIAPSHEIVERVDQT